MTPAALATHAVPTAAGIPSTTKPATQPPAIAAPYKNITIADNAAALTGTIIITSLGMRVSHAGHYMHTCNASETPSLWK